MVKFPKQVRIVEVGPRDGFQNEKMIIPTAQKIELIDRLAKTGLNTIEVTSFVSPKRIPQLADGAQVFAGIKKSNKIRFPVIVPNVQGLELALQAGVKEVAVLCAASETFSSRNTECSIEESIQRIKEILAIANLKTIPVRGYLSCSLGCPYEGYISPEIVAKLAKRLFKMGCSEISLADTIGIGTPHHAQTLIKTVVKYVPLSHLAIHFHDTYGQALANIYACLELGISIIDSSITGLGGCPYARGAAGNVATEDVLYLLNGLGIETGIDLNALVEISGFVGKLTQHPPRSKVTIAFGKS